MRLAPFYSNKKNITNLVLLTTICYLIGNTGCSPDDPPTGINTSKDTPTPEINPPITNTVFTPTADQVTTTSTFLPTHTQLPTRTKTALPALSPTPIKTIPTLPLTKNDCASKGLPEDACIGVAANREWTPLFREFNGFPMALVPAGCFMMGNDNGSREEQPAHWTCIEAPFWIDLTEVTSEQYSWFMNGTNESEDNVPVWVALNGDTFVQIEKKNGEWVPTPGDENRPIEKVKFKKAIELCTWRGGRLLTEAEWEFAARGPDGWMYPWGNEFTPENVVRIYDENAEVGSKPSGASWVGAFDMSSSLHEWVHSIYLPYPYNPLDGRETPLEVDNQSERVLRGGSWYHGDGIIDNLTTTARINVPPWYTTWPFGFRCALSIDF